MLNRCVLAGVFLLTAALPLHAQSPAPLPPITIGAGLQTSFVHNVPKVGANTDQFPLNSARLYVNGPVTSDIKFMFNTEYKGSTNAIGVLDAVARFEMNPKFNIWAGRFIPPSDRADLYGPYYAHHWAVYTDGVQDGYPTIATGRDNGVAYWGQFGKVKVSAGGFDGPTTTGNPDVLGAARVQVDFWDAEDGYYQNGTYYGGKNLLAIGIAGQAQSGKTPASVNSTTNTAWNADFLLEKKLPSGGVVSIESQYNKYNKLGGYDGNYASNDGAYALASYLFPQKVGKGQFEVLGKYAGARFEKGYVSTAANPDYTQKTTEINLNYVIKEFNARIMFFFLNTDFNKVKTDSKQVGVGLQIQM